jgi:hypothetical protein
MFAPSTVISELSNQYPIKCRRISRRNSTRLDERSIVRSADSDSLLPRGLQLEMIAVISSRQNYAITIESHFSSLREAQTPGS